MKALCPLLCILLIALLTAPVAADNPPATRPQPPHSFATPEEAAADCLLREVTYVPRSMIPSRDELIARWRKGIADHQKQPKEYFRDYPILWQGAIGENGAIGYIWNVCHILGYIPASNVDWMLITREPDGQYRVMKHYFGIFVVLPSVHNGRHDLLAMFHVGVGPMPATLCIYDPNKGYYIDCWSYDIPGYYEWSLPVTLYDSNPIQPAPFPAAILSDIAKRHFNSDQPLAPQLAKAWCFKGDFDHDGHVEYLLGIDQGTLNDRKVKLGREKRPNWFLYQRVENHYRLIIETYHQGYVLMPKELDKQTAVLGIMKLLPRNLGSPEPDVELILRGGKIIKTIQHERD